MPRMNIIMNDHTSRTMTSFQNPEDISTGLLARFCYVPVQENFPTRNSAQLHKLNEDRGTILNVLLVLYLHVITILTQY